MCRCIPRTYSIRYNHLSLGMPESSPYSSTNMRLSPSYSILPIHMICIVLNCIIVIFTCLGFTLFSFIRIFIWFYCFFTFTYKFKTTKIFSFLFLYLVFSLYSIQVLLLIFIQSFPCFACLDLVQHLVSQFIKNKVPSFTHLAQLILIKKMTYCVIFHILVETRIVTKFGYIAYHLILCKQKNWQKILTCLSAPKNYVFQLLLFWTDSDFCCIFAFFI